VGVLVDGSIVVSIGGMARLFIYCFIGWFIDWFMAGLID